MSRRSRRRPRRQGNPQLHDWPASEAASANELPLLVFVDGGKKLALVRHRDASKKEDGARGLLSLVLTDDENAALEKAISALPKTR